MPNQPTIVSFTHYAELWGANLSLLTLASNLVKRGWKVAIVVPTDGSLVKMAKQHGIEVVIMPFYLCCHFSGPDDFWSIPAKPYTPKWFWRALRRWYFNRKHAHPIAEFVSSFGASIVHSNSSWITIGTRVAHLTRLPHVWHLREFGHLDYGAYPDWGLTVQRHVIRSAGPAIAISRAIKTHFFPRNGDLESPRVIYNGVAQATDIARIKDESTHKRAGTSSEREFTFASIGILMAAKGHDICIRALKLAHSQLPTVRLAIVGDGPDKASLQSLAQDLGVSHLIESTGRVENMHALYSRVDSVIVASRCEAMGRTTAEAMAYGIPVVGRDSGATPELVLDGETGLLFDGTPEDLAKAMVRIASSTDTASRYAENSLSRAKRLFSIENYVEQVTKVFESTIADHQNNRLGSKQLPKAPTAN